MSHDTGGTTGLKIFWRQAQDGHFRKCYECAFAARVAHPFALAVWASVNLTGLRQDTEGVERPRVVSPRHRERVSVGLRLPLNISRSSQPGFQISAKAAAAFSSASRPTDM
jgi:hypothetical protein